VKSQRAVDSSNHRLWTKTCYGRFDFRCDLRFADESKRSIIEQELATEPLSARTPLDFISTTLFGIEGEVHERSLALEIYNIVATCLVIQNHPKLPMVPSIIAPDDVPNIQANNYGDPLSHLGIPSNGIGSGGGIGSGFGGGVGSGKGAGIGPGTGGGFGGGAFRIGGGVSAPSVLSKVEPEYSEEARKAKWQGSVVLSVIVDELGRPRNVKVLRSLGLGLDQKAVEAVEQWRFKPGLKDGKPVPVMATIEVNFRLL